MKSKEQNIINIYYFLSTYYLSYTIHTHLRVMFACIPLALIVYCCFFTRGLQ